MALIRAGTRRGDTTPGVFVGEQGPAELHPVTGPEPLGRLHAVVVEADDGNTRTGLSVLDALFARRRWAGPDRV